MGKMETKPRKRKSKKDNHFKLSTDWLLTEPVDYEHKYYMLMDFLNFCDDKIEKFELYPLFSEMSLHLANLQTISSEFKYIIVNKKFEVIDDEILINELKFTPIPKLGDDELEELNKVLKYAGPKFFEYFNVIKALWTLTYDSVSIKHTNEKKNQSLETGYFFTLNGNNKKIWKYVAGDVNTVKHDSKFEVKLIFDGESKKVIKTILNELTQDISLPIFELMSSNDLPFENTLLPIFKRKVLSYIVQKKTIVNLKKN
jgi:hypothetical protein